MTQPSDIQTATPHHYHPRIQRVCDYVQQHLNDEISLDTLSDLAAFSKYHFHRVFSAQVGVSISQYVLLCRLKRASFRLAFEHQKRIIDIAFEAGFERPEAFSKAFKRTFGQSPSEFRERPQWPQWHARFEFDVPTYGQQQMQVTIVNFLTTKVAKLEHLGPPENVLATAGRFIAWRKTTGLSPVKTSNTYGIPYSDPNTTPPEQFRWDVCGSIDQDVPANEFGVVTGMIPGGRCARIRHLGSHDSLDDSIYYVYRQWLPQSGENLRDFPCFFHYVNLIHEVDECDLITDVYVPLL